jgi:ATP-dependent DNA ligase
MREFRTKARTGKTRVWFIGVDGDQVVTEFGEEGGAMQHVADTAQPVNVGKANEKSGEEVAVEMMERQILLKTRGGYVEVGKEVGEVEMCFDPLPPTLRFYKPDNELSLRLEAMVEKGTALMVRKRDGEMMVWVVSENGVKAYSRTMLREHDKEPGVPWEKRFPHIAAELWDRQLPADTILLGEMLADSNGFDRPAQCESVFKSLCARALEVQSEKGWLSYYVWDVAWLGGECLLRTTSPIERFHLAQEVCAGATYLLPPQFQTAGELGGSRTPNFYDRALTYRADKGHNVNVALATAHVAQWEGYVVVDPHGDYGDRAWNLRGKVDRPGKYCGKLKPVFEDDVAAYWNPSENTGEYGTGKYQGLIGAVDLYQYDTSGNLIYLCQCGNGFNEEFLRSFSDPAHFPMCVRVKYDKRTYVSQGAKTNALTFPRFAGIRTDKTPEECVNPRL